MAFIQDKSPNDIELNGKAPCPFLECHISDLYSIDPFRHLIDHHHVPVVKGLVVRLKLEHMDYWLKTIPTQRRYVPYIIESHNRMFGIEISLVPEGLSLLVISLTPLEKENDTFWVGLQFESKDKKEQVIHANRVYDETRNTVESLILGRFTLPIHEAKELMIPRKSTGGLKLLIKVYIHKFENE